MLHVGPLIPETMGLIWCGVLWILRRKYTDCVFTGFLGVRNVISVWSMKPELNSAFA